MTPITLTVENFKSEVVNSPVPVLVDFWAPWCGPCRMVSPIVDEVAREVQNAKVGKVNIDEHPELASQYNVMTIPTLIVFKGGQAVKTSIGVKPKAAIRSLLED